MSLYDSWKTQCYEDTCDDPLEDVECSVCGKMLDEDALASLNEEREPDESNAMCTPCGLRDGGYEEDAKEWEESHR